MGYSPSILELRRTNNPLYCACRRYFGKFNKAKKIAGLSITKPPLKKFIPEPSIKKISPELGYIVGAILGDGHIYYNQINLDVADRSFVNYFAKQLVKWCNKKPKIYIIPKGEKFYRSRGYVSKTKKRYKVSLSSMELARFLMKKCSDLSWIYKSPISVKKMVLKGLFDAEGSINIENKIEIANTDPKIRHLVVELCSDISIPAKAIGREKSKVRMLGGIKSKIIFYEKIGVTIPRKRKRLEKHLNYYKKRGKAYQITMKLRKKGFSREKVKKELKNQGYKIPIDTIDSWVYRKIKPLGL